MNLKQVTLIVAICWSVALLFALCLFPYAYLSERPEYFLNLVGIILRDGSIIFFLLTLHRRTA